ncbi:AMP-binding protein [Streptomyces sp. NBC_00838]|uniref:AMP-binding protein n=1 Tax=Streptomyces sp. NBC_00838 TaxID=2903680 RepID=UPI003870935F|nr:AMP-binding protein [Streptomyces sp. NBC_00838]
MNTTTLTTDATLPGRFLRGLARSADGPAVRAGTGTLTYRELHERALGLAGSLLAGLPAGPRAVGVLVGKGVSAYPTLLAGLYTGVTTVPLQQTFPAARTLRMIEASGVDALIADDDSLPALLELAAAGARLPVLFRAHTDSTAGTEGLGGGEGVGGAAVRPPPMPWIPYRADAALAEPVPTRPDDVAYVLFTSGSTGRPKGVPVTHANTDHYFRLLDARYEFGPEDVFTQNFDLNFDCGMFDLFCAWGSGGTLVPPPAAAYRDMPAFAAEHGLTVWFSTPSAVALIRRMGGLRPGAMDTLRWSFFAGEALSSRDADDWAAAAPGSVVENLYGPTELTITVSSHRWTPGQDRALNGMVPIGTVHEGHAVLLLPPDGEQAPPGVPASDEGELCIAGPQLTAGYLDPQDDEGRFLDRDGQRWYRTGDRVRRDADGVLHYLGRGDSQVQVHGVRVELAEVEAAARECDGVQDAVAVAVPTGGTVELAVFYTGRPVPPAELARGLRRTLPVAVVPKRYTHLDAFPLNSNRKTDRRQLAVLATGAPPPAAADTVTREGTQERSYGAK